MSEVFFTILSVCGLFILSQLSPGPDVFFIFRTALARGFRGGAAVSSGIMAGFAIQAALVMTAGRWLMEQSWSRWILVLAALWLLHLAYKIFPFRPRKTDDSALDAQAGQESMLTLFRQGFLCNILNPKCTLFIAGLALPALKQCGDVPWFAPVLLAAIVLSNWASWCMYCALLQWHPVRGFYTSHTRAIDTVFAILLAIFGLNLLIAPIAELL